MSPLLLPLSFLEEGSLTLLLLVHQKKNKKKTTDKKPTNRGEDARYRCWGQGRGRKLTPPHQQYQFFLNPVSAGYFLSYLAAVPARFLFLLGIIITR